MSLESFLLFIAIANSVVLLALFAVVLKDLKIVKSGLLYISLHVHHIVNVVDVDPAVQEEENAKDEVNKLVNELREMMQTLKEVEEVDIK